MAVLPHFSRESKYFLWSTILCLKTEISYFSNLSPVVGHDETYYSLKFMNKIVGVDDEESRWHWIQRLTVFTNN
jgi:hypothetical protein